MPYGGIEDYETSWHAVTFKMTIGPLPEEKVFWLLVIYCPQYLRNRREFEFLPCQLCSAWSLLTVHNYESSLIFVEQKQKLLAGVTLISLWWHTKKMLILLNPFVIFNPHNSNLQGKLMDSVVAIFGRDSMVHLAMLGRWAKGWGAASLDYLVLALVLLLVPLLIQVLTPVLRRAKGWVAASPDYPVLALVLALVPLQVQVLVPVLRWAKGWGAVLLDYLALALVLILLQVLHLKS